MTDKSYGEKDVPPRVQRYLRRVEKALEEIEGLDDLGERLERQDRDIVWVKLMWRAGPSGEMLLMVKVLGTDGGPEIAYVGDESVLMVLAKLMREVRNGSLKWQQDKFHDYAGNEGGNGESAER